MEESLAWLRLPETAPALSDLLCGLIRDIRLILVHSDLGNASKLAAITETIDQLAPPPGPQVSNARTAAFIVALLSRNNGPATILFEELAGEQIHVELTSHGDRGLTAAECGELYLAPGGRGHQRTGTLRTASGLAVAEVSSVVVAGRLPASARKALGIPGPDEPAHPPSPSGIPLGKVLADLGVRREPLGARLLCTSTRAPGGISVESSARMWLANIPVALASERVTTQFCRRVGGRLASTQDVAVPELRAS